MVIFTKNLNFETIAPIRLYKKFQVNTENESVGLAQKKVRSVCKEVRESVVLFVEVFGKQ